MNLKEIFHFNNLFHMIKLDHSEKDFSVVLGEGNIIEEKIEDDNSMETNGIRNMS